MPDLAEQDSRGPLRAPASGARHQPPPIAGEPSPVVVVTGPSGVGKGTLIRAVQERFPGLELSVSATTRSPRSGEIDGRDYWFLTPEEFERRLEAGDFLEHATYAGNRYGTLRSEVERMTGGAPEGDTTPSGEDSPLRSGAAGAGLTALVLEIEVEGARQVRAALPEATQVFIAPPSLEALRARLVGRGADTADQIGDRLAVAERELGARDEFAHVIVNDRLEQAVEELARLVASIWNRPTKGAPP